MTGYGTGRESEPLLAWYLAITTMAVEIWWRSGCKNSKVQIGILWLYIWVNVELEAAVVSSWDLVDNRCTVIVVCLGGCVASNQPPSMADLLTLVPKLYWWLPIYLATLHSNHAFSHPYLGYSSCCSPCGPDCLSIHADKGGIKAARMTTIHTTTTSHVQLTVVYIT